MSRFAFELRGLGVRIGRATILSGVDLQVPSGSSLGVVGRSGSGKSMTAKALAGLLPEGAQVEGEYRVEGHEVILDASERAWRGVRGSTVVWLPQDPFTSLDPLSRCGDQVLASWPQRRSAGRVGRRAEAVRRLAEVGLPSRVVTAFPHQLSGGMRQRVAIAAALASDPSVLIADEPTTALDVTTQAEILDLLTRLRAGRGLTLVLITHDLALATERCDYLAVVDSGKVVESGPTAEVVAAPRESATRALLAARISLDSAPPPIPSAGSAVVLRAEGVTKTYPGAAVPALTPTDVEVFAGEVVGIVGESGSGKSTLARCLVGLERPDAGAISFFTATGDSVGWAPDRAQLVFQNPYASLNPARSVGASLAEALRSARRSPELVGELLDLVGLDPALALRRPARLSGGERQRVAIARALAPLPRLLICDEAVSALDAPVQAKILEVLTGLRDRLGLGILFITHDLAVVSHIAQRVYVMSDGQVVEQGLTDSVLRRPEHPYTRALLASVPGGTAPRPEEEDAGYAIAQQ